ncbi:hypothetical protein BKA69DRAFT_1171049 [Paraphysoderma sedebokerense]|nr:hypothetical protein BKA69DRAFT_1171049 [Paraphysoderma sedebokerense]
MLTKKLVFAIAVVVAYAGSLSALPTENEDPTGVFIPEDSDTVRANLDREMSGPGDVPSVIESNVDNFRKTVDEEDTIERVASGTSDRKRKLSSVADEESPSPMEAVSDQPSTGMKARNLKSGQNVESDVIPRGTRTTKEERKRAMVDLDFTPTPTIDPNWKPSDRRFSIDDLE